MEAPAPRALPPPPPPPPNPCLNTQPHTNAAVAPPPYPPEQAPRRGTTGAIHSQSTGGGGAKPRSLAITQTPWPLQEAQPIPPCTRSPRPGPAAATAGPPPPMHTTLGGSLASLSHAPPPHTHDPYLPRPGPAAAGPAPPPAAPTAPSSPRRALHAGAAEPKSRAMRAGCSAQPCAAGGSSSTSSSSSSSSTSSGSTSSSGSSSRRRVRDPG